MLLLALAMSLSIACQGLRSVIISLSGKSEGKLVANAGMTLAEVQSRSSLKLASIVHYPSGEELTAGGGRFDFAVAGTAIHFEGCRYYWLMTGKHDVKLDTISVGVSPEKLNVEQLSTAYQRLERQLREDGWLQGHLHLQSPPQFVPPKTVPWGNLFAWSRDDTLMLLRDKRMDEEKPGEDERAGEFILYVELYPRAYENYRDWEFSPIGSH
jgi:hypothetical protein